MGLFGNQNVIFVKDRQLHFCVSLDFTLEYYLNYIITHGIAGHGGIRLFG